MMDLYKDAFWIIGDSFCDSRWSVFVSRYLQTKYPSVPNTRLYNYAESSCDTQTIIDNWTKLLPHMSEGDAIVVCVSDISRVRYPKHPEFVYGLPHWPNPYNGPEINSYFRYAPIGYSPATEPHHTIKLDVPFTDMKEFAKFCRLENTILSTKSYDNSKIDIIEALYKLTPCHKKFIYTWTTDDILKSDCIYSKDWLTENVFDGKWETQHDVWLMTNGEKGIRQDFHLSDACDKIMAESFIKEFGI